MDVSPERTEPSSSSQAMQPSAFWISDRPTTGTARLLGGALAAFLALVQFRMVAFVLGPDYGRSVEAAYGVVTGEPHWRLYQSRVLGPYMVEALSAFLPSYTAAHVVFSIATLTVAGYLAWSLGRRIGETWHAALLGLLAFHLLFAALLSRPWLYVWDYLDAVTFLVFLRFVLDGRPWSWFVALFVVAVFNRETALYVALWMIVDPLIRWGRTPVATRKLDRPMIAAGAGCFAAGLMIAEALRRFLLVEEVGPRIFIDAGVGPGQFFANQIELNLRILTKMTTKVDYAMPLVIPLFLALVVILAIGLARREPMRLTGVALVHILLVGSFLVFSVLVETRAYVALIPFTIMAALLLSTRRPIG